MKKSTLLAVAVSVTAALVAVGCSGAGSKTAQSAQPAPDYAQQYLLIVAPANAALVVMKARVNALPSTAKPAVVAAAMAPYAAASSDMDENLLRVAWPANVMPDIRSLVTADKITEGVLLAISQQTVFTLGSWETQIVGDIGAVNAAVSVVRADLGLPPVVNS